jgi:hypothetical protein
MPRFQPSKNPPEGQLVTIKKAAEILGLAPSTVHRWLNDGFIAGEQLTPGAPWRIRITDELRARFVEEAPSVHVRRGKRKGLRIKVMDAHPSLFDRYT